MNTERSFNSQIDRYYFDFDQCTSSDGWAQVDTTNDAPFILRAYKQNSGVAHRVSHCVSETAITLDLRGHVRCNPRK